MTVPFEVFVVASNRRDRRLPGIEKAVDGKFHLDAESAQAAHRQLGEAVGPYYGVYQGLAVLESRLDADYVVDQQPVERGLTVGGLKEADLLSLLEEIYRMGASDAGREDELLDQEQAKEYLSGYVSDRLAEIARGDEDYATRRDVGF